MSEIPIKFKFNAKKAAQAAYKLLKASNGTRNYTELLKLMYLADRAALLKLGSPITGDKFVAMEHGMLLSHVYDLIKDGPAKPSDEAWFCVVSPPASYKVAAIDDPGDDELSGAECKILDEIFEEYGTLTWQQLSEVTHGLPEWVDPESIGSAKSIIIPPEQILKRAGWSEERLLTMSQDLESYAILDREIASLGGG